MQSNRTTINNNTRDNNLNHSSDIRRNTNKTEQQSLDMINHYEREHKVLMIASLPIYTHFYEKSPCTNHYNNVNNSKLNNNKTTATSTRRNNSGGSGGGCFYGERCMFSHSTICKHYKQVAANSEYSKSPNCPFGKKCRYLHLDFKDTKAKRELKVLANSSQFNDTNRTDWFIRKENPLKKHNLKGFIDLVGLNEVETDDEDNTDTDEVNQKYLSIVDAQLNENGSFLTLSDGTVWTGTKESLLEGIQGHKQIGSTTTTMDFEKYKQVVEVDREIPISTLERVPFSVKELNIVKSFSSGCLVTGTFSYYLTRDGSLLSQGCNSFGQLGKGRNDISDSFVPFHIPSEYFNNQQVIDVALGQDHVLVLTHSGQVFSVGINEKGQCGIDPTAMDRIQDFTLIKFPFQTTTEKEEYIIKVACGDEHSLCLSNLGNVYGCGYNQFNQLDPDSNSIVFGKFKKIDIQLAYQNDQITDIVCGPQYSTFLTRFGQVYMCGQNSFSQCCHPSRQTKLISPTHISIRNGSFIKKVICTKGSTSFFITRDNQIYAAGSNDYDMISPLTCNDHFNISKPVNVTNLILPENNRQWWQVEDIQSSPMFFMVHLIRIDHHAKKGMLNCAKQNKFCDLVVIHT